MNTLTAYILGTVFGIVFVAVVEYLLKAKS